MNIQLISHFNSIINIKIHKSNLELLRTIPNEWLFILMNTGSFTKNLNSLTNTDIHIDISQKYNYQTYKLSNIRTVWLKKKNNKFAFAQSRWIINNSNYESFQILTNKPVGESFIINEIDLHKNIEEIYCGHCYNLEKYFESKKPIWGRKYTVLNKNKSLTTIQEYFSPQLTNFLK